MSSAGPAFQRWVGHWMTPAAPEGDVGAQHDTGAQSVRGVGSAAGGHDASDMHEADEAAMVDSAAMQQEGSEVLGQAAAALPSQQHAYPAAWAAAVSDERL